MIVPTAGNWINVFAVVLCATAILVLDAARSSGRSQTVGSVPASADVWRSIFSQPDTIPSPKNNLLTKEEIALGRSLFFDKRLSGKGLRSCASCHDPAKAFLIGTSRPWSKRAATEAQNDVVVESRLGKIILL